MFGTTMPETAVHEHDEFEFGKYEVRPHGGRADVFAFVFDFKFEEGLSSPAGDFVPAQDFHQRELGCFVAARQDSRHYLGTLLFIEDVRHWCAGERRKKRARTVWRIRG